MLYYFIIETYNRRDWWADVKDEDKPISPWQERHLGLRGDTVQRLRLNLTLVTQTRGTARNDWQHLQLLQKLILVIKKPNWL